MLAVFIAAGVSAGASHDAHAATGGVSIKNFTFNPATINIKVGEQVRWINDEDSIPHTVTSETSGAFNSPTLRPGESFLSQPFATEGSFPYFCMIHPRMRGVVNVGAATGSPSAGFPALAAAPISLRLSGANEVPAVTTAANGQFNATVGASSLTWAVQAYGVGITMGHIHLGAAGTNGPVIAFLFGPDAGGQNQINVSGTITEANFVGPMAGKEWSDFTAAMAAGQLYVNFHTKANPGGEIRSQIGGGAAPAAPATGNAQASGTSTLSWLAIAAGVLVVSGGGAVVYSRVRRRS
jgi:plastocyanin